jgi:hypothetical protein
MVIDQVPNGQVGNSALPVMSLNGMGEPASHLIAIQAAITTISSGPSRTARLQRKQGKSMRWSPTSLANR